MKKIPIVLSMLVALCVGLFVRADEPAKPPVTEPVDYKKIKEWLPAQISDQKRTNAEGQKVGMGEFKVAIVQGDYGKDEGDSPRTFHLEITDYGAAKGMADGLAFWDKAEIDQEGDKGFQKSIKLGEYKALITYETESKRGEATAIVAGRFIVKLTMNNVKPEEVLKIAETLKLADLAKLAT